MVYTKKSPALLIIGLLILLWGWLNTTTTIDGLQAWLHPSAAADHQKVAKKYQDDQKAAEKAKAEGKEAPAVKKGSSRLDSLKADQARLATIFGGILTVLGLLVFALPSREGDLDYYLSVFPGIAFILIIALIVRWVLDPMFANWGRAVMDAKILTWNFASIFNLNYVVLGIVIGIITVNVFKIPDWAANGVRTARFFLKTGVILLGTLYSAAELAQLGALSVVMIGVFVLGSVWLVLIMGRRMDAGNSMTGVLASGVGVCGVSAAVAAAPVVQARAVEIAYTIGTILLWGVGCMFIFPTIGQLLGMGPVQFGAWAGTGILNSAQVAGAALAFDPQGIQTLKVAEIFNITRVLFLPLIVVWLAAWYVKNEESAQDMKVDLTQVLVSKFPLFVLGFILMFVLSSIGVFAPAGHYQGRYFDSGRVKAEQLLKEKDIAALQAAQEKVKEAADKKALADLIASKKLTSRDQDTALRGVAKLPGVSKEARDAITAANRVAWHDSKIIRAYRDWIAWLFAFGLIGLGMQITRAALEQAGGKPLIIGGVVGTIKAVGSLIVVLLFVREFV